mmetsp:Transcript_41935/g.98359  ORF Transcript_41935/g.98359 Transcript_41935/m.98359 type:complete len:319 (+) Transcript_41935:1346-2302(+)
MLELVHDVRNLLRNVYFEELHAVDDLFQLLFHGMLVSAQHAQLLLEVSLVHRKLLSKCRLRAMMPFSDQLQLLSKVMAIFWIRPCTLLARTFLPGLELLPCRDLFVQAYLCLELLESFLGAQQVCRLLLRTALSILAPLGVQMQQAVHDRTLMILQTLVSGVSELERLLSPLVLQYASLSLRILLHAGDRHAQISRSELQAVQLSGSLAFLCGSTLLQALSQLSVPKLCCRDGLHKLLLQPTESRLDIQSHEGQVSLRFLLDNQQPLEHLIRILTMTGLEPPCISSHACAQWSLGALSQTKLLFSWPYAASLLGAVTH